MTISELMKGETGERANLKKGLKWVLNEMEYEDFKKVFVLNFHTINYPFQYNYHITKEDDTPKAREEYLKYLMYKLVQNIMDDGVSL